MLKTNLLDRTVLYMKMVGKVVAVYVPSGDSRALLRLVIQIIEGPLNGKLFDVVSIDENVRMPVEAC